MLLLRRQTQSRRVREIQGERQEIHIGCSGCVWTKVKVRRRAQMSYRQKSGAEKITTAPPREHRKSKHAHRSQLSYLSAIISSLSTKAKNIPIHILLDSGVEASAFSREFPLSSWRAPRSTSSFSSTSSRGSKRGRG